MALGTAALVLGGGLSEFFFGGGGSQADQRQLVAVQNGHLQVVVRRRLRAAKQPFDATARPLKAGRLWPPHCRETKDQAACVVPYLYGRHRLTQRSTGPASSASCRGGGGAPRRSRRQRRLPSHGRTAGHLGAAPCAQGRLAVGDLRLLVTRPRGARQSIARGLRRRPKSAPWYDGLLPARSGRRAGAVDRPGADTNQDDTGRRQQRRGAAGAAGGGGHRGRAPGYRARRAPRVATFGRRAVAFCSRTTRPRWPCSPLLFLAAAWAVNSSCERAHERTRVAVRALGMRRGWWCACHPGGVAREWGRHRRDRLGAAGYVITARAGSRWNPALAGVAGGDHLFPLLTAANVARAALAIADCPPRPPSTRRAPPAHEQREALHHIYAWFFLG